MPSALAPLGCLMVCLPLLHALAVPPHSRAPGGKHPGDPKRTPGGTSRGGSSANLDELRNKLNAFRRSVLKEFGGLFDPGRHGPFPTSKARPCSFQNPNDIQRMLPGRFLSEENLMQMVSGTKGWVSSQEQTTLPPSRRVLPGGVTGAEGRQRAQQAAFNIMADAATFSETHSSMCRSCLTEIGYEIMEYVVDFRGINHTVINFKNAYQFIPSGRCLNEHSPCGMPGWRCRQVTRAHWTLVWTPGTGVNLAAHEVPSHCQCLNLGRRQHSSLRPGADNRRLRPTSTAEGDKGRGFGWAGLKMDHAATSSLASPRPLNDSSSSASFPDSSSSSLDVNSASAYIRVNPHPVSSDPQFVSTDPHPVSTDQFSLSSDPNPLSSDHLLVRSDPYPANSDPYPVGSDPYPLRSSTYPESSDPYSERTDPYKAPSVFPNPSPDPGPKSSTVWERNYAHLSPSSSSSSSSPFSSSSSTFATAAVAATVTSNPFETSSTDVTDHSDFTLN